MAKCKICGMPIILGDVYHTDCIGAEMDKLRRENEQLKADLKVSERHELCDFCTYGQTPGVCEIGDFDCNTCPIDCMCKTCDGGNNFEWRGIVDDNHD